MKKSSFGALSCAALAVLLFAAVLTGCPDKIQKEEYGDTVLDMVFLDNFDHYIISESQARKNLEWVWGTYEWTPREDSRFLRSVFEEPESFTKVFKPGFVTKEGKPQTSEIQFYLYPITDPESEKGPGWALMIGDYRLGTLCFVVPEDAYGDLRDTLDFYVEYEGNLEHFRCVIADWNEAYLNKLAKEGL